MQQLPFSRILQERSRIGLGVISQNKERFRQLAIQKRDSLGQEVRKRKSQRITRKLTEFAPVRDSKVLMAYMSMRSEVDTSQLLSWAWKSGKTVALPVTVVKEKQLLAVAVTSFSQLRLGTYEVMEPDMSMGAEVLSPHDLDVVIVPGAAFDSRGHRIGYGGGYYDRFLVQTKCVKIGIAFAEQIYPLLPAEKWDIPVDFIVTDENVIDCRHRADFV